MAPLDAAAEQRMAELGVERIVIDIERSGLNPFADLGLLRELSADPQAARGRPLFSASRSSPTSTAASPPARSAFRRSTISAAWARCSSGAGPLLAFVTGFIASGFEPGRGRFLPESRRPRVVHRAAAWSGRSRRGCCPAPASISSGLRRRRRPTGPADFLLIARLLGDKGVREFVAGRATRCAPSCPCRFQMLGRSTRAIAPPSPASSSDAGSRRGWSNISARPTMSARRRARASAVVLPSYAKACRASLLEAAAMARPLIATDVPGCRESSRTESPACCASRRSRIAGRRDEKDRQSPADRASRWARRGGARFGTGSAKRHNRAYLDALDT